MIHDETTTWFAVRVRVTRGCGLGSDAAREKERGSCERAGDAGLRAMDGYSRGSAGGDAVGGDGRNAENCGPTGRPDDGWAFVHASAFLHGRDKDRAALASDGGKRDGDQRHISTGNGRKVG